MRRTLLPLAVAAALACVSAPAPAAVTVGHSGWEWGSPSPQGQTIRTIEFDGAAGYAAGDFGTLLRTFDGGATWSGASTGVRQSLERIAILDAVSVVVGGGCVARRSDDGGQTFKRLPWTAADDRCAAPLAALDFPQPDVGYLVLEDGALLRTADGGRTWSRRTSVPLGFAGGISEPTDLGFSTRDSGVATTTNGNIYRTIDGGTSWTLAWAWPHALRGLYFVNSLQGYAVGDLGSVLRTVDGGATWIQVASGTERLTSIRCADAARCLIARDSGGLLRTVNGGLSFDSVNPSTDKVLAAAFSSASRAVAVGERGATVVSDDSGASWAPVGERLSATFSRVRAVSSRLVFAVGANGALARSTDGGQSWTSLGVSTAEDVIDVSFVDERVGYALDGAGTVLRTDNAGESWQILNTGTSSQPQAVLAFGSVVLLVGPKGVLRSTDGGGSFTRVRGRPLNRTKLFNVDRGGRTVFAYGSKNIFASTTAGRTWRKVRLPRKTLLQAVDFVSGRHGFALGQDGQVFKTKRRGERWLDLSGVGNDDATGLSFSSPERGYLSLRRFGAETHGYLLRTTDGGRTWQPQLVGPDQPSPDGLVATSPSAAFLLANSRTLLFTTSGGDHGDVSKVSIRTRRRTVRRRAVIRITGRVSGGRGGAQVVVARRERGARGWVFQTATVASNGTFTTVWKLTKTAAFVAQWAGDEDSAGDGSQPLVVRVKRRQVRS